jgi:hypothetical protein
VTIPDFLGHGQNVRAIFNATLLKCLESQRDEVFFGTASFVDSHTISVRPMLVHPPASHGRVSTHRHERPRFNLVGVGQFDDGSRMGNVVHGNQNIPVANGPNHGIGIGFLGLLAVNLNDYLNILPGNIQIMKAFYCFIVIFTSREYSTHDLNFVGFTYGLRHKH